MKCKYHDLKKKSKVVEFKKKQDQTTLHKRIHMYKDFTLFGHEGNKLIIFRKFFLFDMYFKDYSTQSFCSVDKMVNKGDFLKISNLYPIFSRNTSKCCYKFNLWIWEYIIIGNIFCDHFDMKS